LNLIDDIVAWHNELTQWRRDIHAHPELAFEETRTADFVASQLESYGIEVTRGVGKTGLVGTLKRGSSNKAIGLRADMDALPMDELNTFAHKSKTPGCMHGCGHDGHTVMLLAAARYLAQSRDFNGTVQFIFQPAEEANAIGSGAKAMIDDGLFERFPMDSVFALHNAPGLKAGAIATRPGPIMASMDLFEVTVTGQGTHGALPESGIDPVVIAAAMISAWQTIVSRNIGPQQGAVISATTLVAGNSWNVIPQTATIRGSIRALSPEVQQTIYERFHQLTESIAEGFGATVEIVYRKEYPVTMNDGQQTAFACEVAKSIVGEDHATADAPSAMGSEDFAALLEVKPGCYLWLGNSDPVERDNEPVSNDPLGHLEVSDPCMVHEPTYDFNDKIIPVGATLFVRLAEQYLL